jgi:hypothetical protein
MDRPIPHEERSPRRDAVLVPYGHFRPICKLYRQLRNDLQSFRFKVLAWSVGGWRLVAQGGAGLAAVVFPVQI